MLKTTENPSICTVHSTERSTTNKNPPACYNTVPVFDQLPTIKQAVLLPYWTIMENKQTIIFLDNGRRTCTIWETGTSEHSVNFIMSYCVFVMKSTPRTIHDRPFSTSHNFWILRTLSPEVLRHRGHQILAKLSVMANDHTSWCWSDSCGWGIVWKNDMERDIEWKEANSLHTVCSFLIFCYLLHKKTQAWNHFNSCCTWTQGLRLHALLETILLKKSTNRTFPMSSTWVINTQSHPHE